MSYVDEAYYAALVRDFARWDGALADPALRDECRALLVREARLLDEGRLEDWLALFAPECVYWVPGTPGGDPRREVAIAFDDRHRLEDRVYRLRTGHAWSQTPASRTARLLGNIEVFAPGKVFVRSTFMLTEFRAGATRLWSGWCGHRLARRDGRLEIEVRQVNLLDCDQSLHNPSFIL